MLELFKYCGYSVELVKAPSLRIEGEKGPPAEVDARVDPLSRTIWIAVGEETQITPTLQRIVKAALGAGNERADADFVVATLGEDMGEHAPCPLCCGKSFKNRKAYRKHLLAHEQAGEMPVGEADRLALLANGIPKLVKVA